MARPPKYKTKEEMQVKVVKYFKNCVKVGTIPNKAGILLELDMTRTMLAQYKKKKEFKPTIKKAHTKIENAWVDRLNKAAPVGAIFYLKNAFRDIYRDKQDIEHSGNLTIVTTKYESKNSP